jgi:hypothetical protein
MAENLKRHQVLLSDWQTRYLKKRARLSEVSFSEAIRQHIDYRVLKETDIKLRLRGKDDKDKMSDERFKARKIVDDSGYNTKK